MTHLRARAASVSRKWACLVGGLVLAWAAWGWLAVTPEALGPVGAPLLPPFSAEAWLGTDPLGRSIAWHTWRGGAITLGIGAGATLATMLIGIFMGCAAALLPRGFRTAILATMNVWQAIPPVLAILAISMALPLTGVHQIVAITAACWAGVARITSAEITNLLTRPYVQAARALGAGRWHIFWHTLMPNLAPILGTLSAVTAALALTLQSSLAFLGLDSGDVSWGTQIGQGQRYVLIAWWMVLPPSICLMVSIGCIMLISANPAPLDSRPLPR